MFFVKKKKIVLTYVNIHCWLAISVNIYWGGIALPYLSMFKEQ